MAIFFYIFFIFPVAQLQKNSEQTDCISSLVIDTLSTAPTERT